MLAGSTSSTKAGLVVSLTLNVAGVEELFPQISVAVNSTVTAVEQSLDNALKLLVHFTSEQLSLATAPPLLANQFAIAVWLPLPSHSTIMLVA